MNNKAMQNLDPSILAEIDESTRLFKLLYDHWTPNPKKMMKFLYKLYNDTTISKALRDGIIAQAIIAPNSSQYLLKKIHQQDDMRKIIDKLKADGWHGMILLKNDTIIPCKVDTYAKWLEEGKQWNYEQEMLIQHDLANNWMKENDKGSFDGSVILFQEYGFTGLRREIVMKCVMDPIAEGLVRYPGTNYYIKPDA